MEKDFHENERTKVDLLRSHITHYQKQAKCYRCRVWEAIPAELLKKVVI
ncbi:hypothetical protein [Nostoc sp. CALU 1950]